MNVFNRPQVYLNNVWFLQESNGRPSPGVSALCTDLIMIISLLYAAPD